MLEKPRFQLAEVAKAAKACSKPWPLRCPACYNYMYAIIINLISIIISLPSSVLTQYPKCINATICLNPITDNIGATNLTTYGTPCIPYTTVLSGFAFPQPFKTVMASYVYPYCNARSGTSFKCRFYYSTGQRYGQIDSIPLDQTLPK